jgi:hypothetical protein
VSIWHLVDDTVVRLGLLLTVLWIGRLSTRIKALELREDAQNKVLRIFDVRTRAQSRYLRISVKDRIIWSDDHHRRIKALERVGHSHAEMNLEKPTYHVYIDAKDIPPKPE